MSTPAGDLKRNWSASLASAAILLIGCAASFSAVALQIAADQPPAMKLTVLGMMIQAATITGVGTGLAATLIALFVPETSGTQSTS